MQDVCAFVTLKPTFLPDLDGAGGLYSLPIFVPFPGHILHRELTNKHGVLVFLDAQVLRGLEDQQLTLCKNNKHEGLFRAQMGIA